MSRIIYTQKFHEALLGDAEFIEIGEFVLFRDRENKDPIAANSVHCLSKKAHAIWRKCKDNEKAGKKDWKPVQNKEREDRSQKSNWKPKYILPKDYNVFG